MGLPWSWARTKRRTIFGRAQVVARRLEVVSHKSQWRSLRAWQSLPQTSFQLDFCLGQKSSNVCSSSSASFTFSNFPPNFFHFSLQPPLFSHTQASVSLSLFVSLSLLPFVRLSVCAASGGPICLRPPAVGGPQTMQEPGETGASMGGRLLCNWAPRRPRLHEAHLQATAVSKRPHERLYATKRGPQE